MTDTPQATREQVLAFRLAGHNLGRRLPPGSLLAAAAACGVQNSPPGSAALALAARVEGLTPADIDRALEVDKSLLQIWSLRQSRYFIPTKDLDAFTVAIQPQDEESWRYTMQGFVPILDQMGMSATEAVALVRAALADALDGRELTKREMGVELAKRLPAAFGPWLEPDTFSGFGAVLVRPIALTGLFCLAPRSGGEASFVRTDQWLGRPLPAPDPDEARAELVRRYLRCYGPSTPEHFGEWAGIAPSAAERAWQAARRRLVAVGAGEGKAWLWRDDLAAFQAPGGVAGGVRLLPPHDPYLLGRDRETLVVDTATRRQIWRAAGNPGVLLVDGEAAGMWRSRKQGKRLQLTVTPLRALSAGAREVIEAEVGLLAPFRGAEEIAVTYEA